LLYEQTCQVHRDTAEVSLSTTGQRDLKVVLSSTWNLHHLSGEWKPGFNR